MRLSALALLLSISTAHALPAEPMAGWVEFCRTSTADCKVPDLPAAVIPWDADTRRQVRAVNLFVNDTIRPITDQEHWQKPDHWSYPLDGSGDCEDYVLLKRRLLINMGFPRQALLITTVIDLLGEGHAVLMVVTDQGDFVLDNQVDAIRRPNETGYRFLKRQTPENPNRWERLE